ncbi:ATP-binding protein [Dactylosporangium fulvum]|uniref:histidine kinase n=1 Tax=Dactylosporangium fulvum TaxID=53359 RepID=A0ABY5VQF8_9ACTN|nr:HAMP domain-containing sensor histidine kinase [Dactylosporangium fulvum]UWP80012.1 HAMP domain-containing histidine kinase [Dactylosporangium fulvum]
MTRLTIRGRLTLWYAAVFAGTGAVVLALMYLLVRREFFTASDTLVTTLSATEVTGVKPSGTVVWAVPEPVPVIEGAATTARTDALRTIVLETGAVFVGLAAVSLALCWLVAGRALRPLRQITNTAATLSHDTMDARIGLRGPRDEIRTLADTFDAMLDRLARAFQGQRLFVANASHELRTPLTIIRTAAEIALSRKVRTEDEYRHALQTVATAAARSDAMLTSLLQLARTQRGAAREPVDLAAVAAAAAASWPADAPPIHRDLVAAPCVGDPVQLELVLRNLLENAARYNVPGGTVWLSTGHDTGGSWLRVENTGPVVDPADVPALRHAFQRGAGRGASSSGAGLGLAIVEAIVAAHGATWTLAPRDGGGLSVTVCVPAR